MVKPLVITIDDDPDFNILLKLRLKQMGLKVETYCLPGDFLKRIKEVTPALCIIDLNLDINYGAGFQIIQAIRRVLGQDIPLFVMSKRSSRKDIQYALDLGANEYLMKPLDELVLQDKLKQYISSILCDKSLSSFDVPEILSDCNFFVNYKISSIGEEGISFVGIHQLSKGTTISVCSDILFEIMGVEKEIVLTIGKVWFCSETNSYGAFASFDSTDIELMASIRNWIINQNHQVAC